MGCWNLLQQRRSAWTGPTSAWVLPVAHSPTHSPTHSLTHPPLPPRPTPAAAVVLDSKLYTDQATEEGANVTTAIGEDLKIWSKWVAAGAGLGGKGGRCLLQGVGWGALCCRGH